MTVEINKELDLYFTTHQKVRRSVDKIIRKVKIGKITKEKIKDILFWREPPVITKFLTREYIGSLEYNLYPAWKEAALEIFGKGSIVNEVILTGSTATGKTTFATLLHYYNLLRTVSYRTPQAIFGVPEVSILAIVFINLTKDKAKVSNIALFKSLLNSSQLFYETKKKSFDPFGYYTFPDGKIPYYMDLSNDSIKMWFPNRILVYSGSNLTHILGMNLFGLMFDEVEYRRSNVKGSNIEEALEIYTTSKERIMNRFLDRRNIMMTLISSSRSEEGVIPNYISTLDANDPKVRIYSYAIWDVKKFDSYDKGSFYVFAGNKRNPSHILSDEEVELYSDGKLEIPRGCEVIEVPLVYLPHFQNNLMRALRNLAGHMTSETEYLIDDYTVFDDYDETLLPELDVKASLYSKSRLITYIESLFVETPGLGKMLKRAPSALRYLHADLAATTEAGLSMYHKELDKDGSILYVRDFTMKITSPDRIDIEKIQDLIEDMVKRNVKFAYITADQYQSEQLIQYATKNDFAKIVGRLSVSGLEAYLNYARLINKRRIRIGYSPELRGQVEVMQLDANNVLLSARKDMADAECGAITTAMEYVFDMPTYFYHDYSTAKKKQKEDVSNLEEIYFD